MRKAELRKKKKIILNYITHKKQILYPEVTMKTSQAYEDFVNRKNNKNFIEFLKLCLKIKAISFANIHSSTICSVVNLAI